MSSVSRSDSRFFRLFSMYFLTVRVTMCMADAASNAAPNAINNIMNKNHLNNCVSFSESESNGK